MTCLRKPKSWISTFINNRNAFHVRYVQPSSSTMLFVFVYSTLTVFMLFHHLTTTLSLLYSQTKIHPIHFIYHGPSHLFLLPKYISFILLIIVHHFHIYHIWSYLCYIVIHYYFYDRWRKMILLIYAFMSLHHDLCI